MCGIHGFNFNDKSRLEGMVRSTAHRGPDGSGFFVDDEVSLGHNLLAITEVPDLGRQPFYSQDGQCVLIYNGEIYNYKDLKRELEEKGHQFHTQGDTEVLLIGLRTEGQAFLKKLNGMFAFAFYDKSRRTLLLARDSSGMKPLYYRLQDGELVFASEIRALLTHPHITRNLNHEALGIFFEIGYVPGPMTLIDGIRKMMPGECLSFDLGRRKADFGFFSEPAGEVSENFDAHKFRAILGQSVIDHTMGLRPFGMYLSGGLDSSIVLYELIQHGITKPITYTTRFAVDDQRFNEDADVAAFLSRELGADHHELLVTEHDFMEAIPRMIEVTEEPRYHPSRAAYYLLAQEASKESVVILTGDGGDEQYMGYPKYYRSWEMSKRYRRYPSVALNLYYSLRDMKEGKIPPGMYMKLHDPLVRWWYMSKLLSRRNQPLFRFPISSPRTLSYLASLEMSAVRMPSPDFENAVADFDRLFWLAEDSFAMTDKIGMHFGMEARFPFVDRRMTQYSASIPSQEKLEASGTKGLIRHAYGQKLPKQVADKRKSGWTAPVTAWMGSDFGGMVREVLSPGYYKDTAALFNLDSVSRYARPDVQHTSNTIKSWMPIFNFQVWAKTFKIQP